MIELRLDCDRDTVLALVRPAGAACHTGSVTCFGSYDADQLARLDTVIAQRAADPSAVASYTRALLGDENRRLKKLGEEAVELALACRDGDPAKVAEEAADLLYHIAVAVRGAGSSLEAARAIIATRAAPSPSESPDGAVG
jgi:phosphoribosyl-ATP pyrophosphohydrolase/phosphoribosyl-AMP cyclohydrolase